MFLQFRRLHWKNSKFFCCAEHKRGIYHDHRVQISTSMILTKVLRPHFDIATDFPVVHHRGRSRAGCSHMTSDLPLGNQWGGQSVSWEPLPSDVMASGSGLFANPSPMAPLATRSFALFIQPERGGERNRIWKRKHQGSRPSQITRNFCLTSLEVANTGIECFFKNWIWRKDWRSMGIPLRVAGDRIHCKVIGESMWFPWFTLPLWELIFFIASDTVRWSVCSYVNGKSG